MRCQSVIFLLLLSASSVHAIDCGPLTPTLSPPPAGLRLFRVDMHTRSELLGYDGARISLKAGTAPVPDVSRKGTTAIHPANLVDIALYDERSAAHLFRYMERGGRLLACRIDHDPEFQGDVERFIYDEQGRMRGWQLFVHADGTWKVRRQACFIYDPKGRFTAAHEAEEFIDCELLKPEEANIIFVHDKAGRLSRTVERLPLEQETGRTSDRGKTKVVVKLFDGQGAATHIIDTDAAGDRLAYPAGVSKSLLHDPGSLHSSADERLKLTETIHIDIVAFSGEEKRRHWFVNEPWQIVLTDPEKSPRDACGYGTVRVLASGKLDSRGFLSTSAIDRERVWSAARANPGRVCLVSPPGEYFLLRKYSDEEWAACLDPRQAEASACPVH